MHKKKILFSALFFPAVIWAQSTAQITGKVVNSDKKPVPALKVTLNDGAAEAITDENGVYHFNNIPAGHYILKVDDPEVTKTYSFILKENDQLTYNFVQTSSAYQIQTVNVVANRKTMPSSTLRLGENLLVTPQNIQVIDQRLLNDQQILTTAEGLSRNVSGVRTITHQEEGCRKMSWIFIANSQCYFIYVKRFFQNQFPCILHFQITPVTENSGIEDLFKSFF